MYLSDSIHGLPGANLGFEGLSPCKIVGLSVSPSFSQHIVSQSVSRWSECAQLSSSFCFRLPSAHLLPPPPPSPPPSAGWISQETSPLPHSAAVSQSSLPDPPPTKEHDSNFPPKTQIPGRFTSVQETGRSSRSAHWPRNGGGRSERRRPAEEEEEEENGEGRSNKKQYQKQEAAA